MRDFRNLKVWLKAHQLTLGIYAATSDFPRIELYGLTTQMRRAAFSIPANIAEGCGRGGTVEFSRYLVIATGSASELEYFLLLARDLRILSCSDYARLNENVRETKRMLAGLIKRLR